MPSRINELLDRLPRSHVRLGGAAVPVYLACGVAGALAGALVLLTAAASTGASLLVALALAPLAAATFVGFGLARRMVTGGETTVLLEHLFAVLGAAYGALRVARLAPLPWLDLLALALSVFMIFGRVGCLLAGCCYGVPAGFGVRYPEECGHETATRRVPVPLVEIAVWLALAIAGAVLIARRPPGAALALTLAGYGVARLGCELLRGDRRPRLLGLNEGQWLSLLAIAAGVAIDQRVPPPLPVTILAGAGAAAALGLAWTRRRWLTIDRGLEPRQLDALAALGRRLRSAALTPAVSLWPEGELLIGAALRRESSGAVLSLSISSASRPLVRAEAALALQALLDGLGALASDPHPRRGRQGLYLIELPWHLPAAERRAASES